MNWRPWLFTIKAKRYPNLEQMTGLRKGNPLTLNRSRLPILDIFWSLYIDGKIAKLAVTLIVQDNYKSALYGDAPKVVEQAAVAA